MYSGLEDGNMASTLLGALTLDATNICNYRDQSESKLSLSASNGLYAGLELDGPSCGDSTCTEKQFCS